MRRGQGNRCADVSHAPRLAFRELQRRDAYRRGKNLLAR